MGSSSNSSDRSTGRSAVWVPRSLHVDQYIDVRDSTNKWCEGVVVGTTQHKVHVHYRNWPTKFNEWITFESPRLAPAYSHVRNWRVLRKGDRVQLSTDVNGVKAPVWRNGTVRQVRRGEGKGDGPVTVQVQLDGDRETRWVDVQDDSLAPPNTHRVPRAAHEDENSESDDDDARKPETISILSDDDDDSSNSDDSDDRMPTRRTPATRSTKRDAKAPTKRKRTDDDDDFATWREGLGPGALLEVADEKRKLWYEARVCEARKREVRVRFRGWPWRYDEWLLRSSPRLAPTATHLGRWRDFSLNDKLQLGFRASTQADGPSHWVQGTVVKLSRSAQTRQLCRIYVEWTNEHGDVEREWRRFDDDFLARAGVPTYPLPKRRGSNGPAVGGLDDNEAEEEEGGMTPEMEIVTPAKATTDAFERDLSEVFSGITPDDIAKAIASEPPAEPLEKLQTPSPSDELTAPTRSAQERFRQTLLEALDKFKTTMVAAADADAAWGPSELGAERKADKRELLKENGAESDETRTARATKRARCKSESGSDGTSCTSPAAPSGDDARSLLPAEI